MLSDVLARIPARYWNLLILVIWGGLVLLLLRQDGYGLDEGAARALLLNWSIVDNIANPIVIFGVPDFRALLFIPVGIYWSGSLLAAKVFTLILTFIAALLLYQWSMRTLGKEVALLATGLLLISPITVQQIDSLAAGPYLLLVFALGAWLDDSYRAVNRPMGGKFFTQMLLVAISVSLHPAGLAYPFALLWRWYKDPLDKTQQRHIYVGIAVAVLFTLLLRMGWQGLEWWSNPFNALTNAVLGPSVEGGLDTRLWMGVVVAIIGVTVIISARRQLLGDLLGSTLLGGILIGALSADPAWAMLVLVMVLYYGFALLITINQSLGTHSLVGQRGIVMAVLLIMATLFMNIDKAYYSYTRSGILPPQDQLIHTLALQAEADKPFRAVSQWPARTMIAVKRDVLPLPPAAKDGAGLLKMLPTITHLMFDPYASQNKRLAANVAELPGTFETLALQPGGVILKMRAAQKPPTPPAAKR